ncbi:type I methionyl aminopeptidase [Patulibacter defluvii]|uniref:type I methionyl aminopeptidase n=1 Tax=Patulibacter defluvii TaxID=3095358 RepID=UPI002A74C8C4|nr:type I methionyl aminopeptidase [Patulibacter sp. DM4]
MAVRLKRPDEVDAIAAAGRVVADVLDELQAAVRPGMTTADLDGLARERIAAAGGTPSFLGYRGFTGAICASPNDLVVHGIPGPVRLDEGDIVSLDVGVTLDGWVADAARTVAVGEMGAADGHLVETAEAALVDAVAACRVGGHIGDIGAAVEARARAGGLQVFPSLIGHGVGRALHEEPQVPNVGRAGTGRPLEAGLVIAVEPMLTLGRAAIRMADDGWSVFTVDGARATHAEVTVAITEEGPRVLTPWGDRSW